MWWLALVVCGMPGAVANLIFSDSGTTAPLRGAAAAASGVARGSSPGGHPSHIPSAENVALAGAAAFETAEECHVQHHAGYGSFSQPPTENPQYCGPHLHSEPTDGG